MIEREKMINVSEESVLPPYHVLIPIQKAIQRSGFLIFPASIYIYRNRSVRTVIAKKTMFNEPGLKDRK